MNTVRRKLLNLATALSALLAMAALTMQVRSGYAADSWELPPRSAPGAGKAKWVTHRHIESADGRLVWISYDTFEFKPVPWEFYQVVDVPLTPGQRGRNDWQFRPEYAAGMVHRRIPYIAEWYTYHGRRYIAVPWPLLILAFALLPVARWLWSRRQDRAKPGPAFPVVPSN